ncbi:MAG: hypothetical protein M0Q88_05930 [Bacilli bacterium]|nr:hypothetical protein [Bacilli bacterium]
MFINKKSIIVLMVILMLFPTFSFAQNDKVDEQNKLLYDEIIKRKNLDESPLDKVYDEMRKRDEDDSAISLKGIANFIYDSSIKLALVARKFIVPITLLLLLFNTFMLAVTGAKNIKNRKKYIIGSVLLYVVFLFVLNFPLYLLWRHSISSEELLSFNSFYMFVENLSLFLKENSFVMFVIIFSFGVVNRISSEVDLPKRLASNFIIKVSFALLVLFNIMPLLVKLAV